MTQFYLYHDTCGFVWFDYDNQKMQSTYNIHAAVSYESMESIGVDLESMPEIKGEYVVLELKN